MEDDDDEEDDDDDDRQPQHELRRGDDGVDDEDGDGDERLDVSKKVSRTARSCARLPSLAR